MSNNQELLEMMASMMNEIKELKAKSVKPEKVKAVRGPRKAKEVKSQEPCEMPPLMVLENLNQCKGRVYGAKKEYDAVCEGYSPTLFSEARCKGDIDIDGLCIKCYGKRKEYLRIKDDPKVNTGNFVQKSIKWFGVIGEVPNPEAHFPHSEWALKHCKKVSAVAVPEAIVPQLPPTPAVALPAESDPIEEVKPVIPAKPKGKKATK
jgi:hypothetical protein